MSHLVSDMKVISEHICCNYLNQGLNISVFDDICLYEKSCLWHVIFKTAAQSTKVKFRNIDGLYSKDDVCTIDSIASCHPYHIHLVYHHEKR